MIIHCYGYHSVGGLTCIDVVDNVQQNGNEIISPGRTVIVPRLNFTCNGEITNIRVRVSNRTSGTNFPYIQLWRESSTPQLYNLVGQVQIQSSHISSTGLTHQEANIVLTSIDRIQFLSGDVIGFYNPSDTGYVIDDIQTDGYVYYVFVGSSASSQNLNNGFTSNRRQPLIQFTIGESVYIYIIYVVTVLCTSMSLLPMFSSTCYSQLPHNHNLT